MLEKLEFGGKGKAGVLCEIKVRNITRVLEANCLWYAFGIGVFLMFRAHQVRNLLQLYWLKYRLSELVKPRHISPRYLIYSQLILNTFVSALGRFGYPISSLLLYKWILFLLKTKFCNFFLLSCPQSIDTSISPTV